jgi:hypothetical protein
MDSDEHVRSRSALLRALRATYRADGSAGEMLTCDKCATRVPVRSGIPRFVVDLNDELRRRTQQSFGLRRRYQQHC